MNITKTNNDIEDFNQIVDMIETSQRRVYRKINDELISLYWEIGHYVSEKLKNNEWGSKTVQNLAGYIRNKYPTLKGFDRSGIYRMRQFYEAYYENEIVAPLVRQISWTNNLLILGKVENPRAREFYIKLCIKNNYSKRELERQISSLYYERYMLSSTSKSLPIQNDIKNDYPSIKILDTYSLEFLELPRNFEEKDIKKAIIKNMKNFILEIGKTFTYIGEEYRVTVGDEDFYIDLLFYNRELSCLVAFELKTEKFKPEYISKMDFYLEALDRQVKLKTENPSVGVILCAGKNEEIVEYAMSRSASPTMIAEYKLKLIDKELLENKLKEISLFMNDK